MKYVTDDSSNSLESQVPAVFKSSFYSVVATRRSSRGTVVTGVIIRQLLLFALLTLAFQAVESSHTFGKSNPASQRQPHATEILTKFFPRRRMKKPTTNDHSTIDQENKNNENNNPVVRYPWKSRLSDSCSSSQLRHAIFFLNMQSATKFLLLLQPHKRYIVTGAAAYYLVHKCRTSEPIRRSIYFWKHAGPIVFHYKFTQWWFAIHPTIDRKQRDAVYEQLHGQYAPKAYDIILHLRGLYVKIGQLFSSRPDFMPIQYIQYFTKLQDNIPAIDTATVQATAIDSLQKHCPEAFAKYEAIQFDPIPLGSASIGQVHRAVLYHKQQGGSSSDTKPQEVAIKVMHTNAEQKFRTDLQVFRWLCRIAIPSWLPVLSALQEQIMKEFNYKNEAQSLQTVRDMVMESPHYRNRVVVPQPMHELCCDNVLVMELLHGKKLIDSIRDTLIDAFSTSNNTNAVNEFLRQRQNEVLLGKTVVKRNNQPLLGDDDTMTTTTTLSSMDIINKSVGLFGKLKLLFLLQQCRNVIDLLVDVHGYQIFHGGVWNGDPHFGNCLKLDDGRLGLIDYGQTRRINNTERIDFARIVVALNQNVQTVDTERNDVINQRNITDIARYMRLAGFSTRNNTDDETMFHYAQLIFDSDEEGARRGYSIPQEYFKSLMDVNPILGLPDSAVFVARTSLLFRGMGSAIGAGQIRTSSRWYKHARKALQ